MHNKQTRAAVREDNLRQALRTAFPSVVFRIFHRADGGVNLFWTDGPSVPKVRRIVAKHPGMRVDLKRRYTPSLISQAIKRVCKEYHLRNHFTPGQFQSSKLGLVKLKRSQAWSVDNNLQQQVAVTLNKLQG